ncbi:MAG: hypothetical protein QM626_06150 [Microbacterium sp.]|uniref:hypothetical protein n=1 Tax=Microbacterium sp. TaxID=51671 RepID=UPI0039E4B17C
MAVLVLGTLAAWFRLPASARNAMWGEDAAIFSDRALHPELAPYGPLTAYDGYTHLLPQLLADFLWRVAPAEYMAQAFTAAACLVAGAVAVGIFLLTARWNLNLLGRILLASLTVLTPGLSFEVLGNLANLHWFLLWLTPFLYFFRPRRWWSAIVAGCVAYIATATEVQSLLFAPLLLWRIRDRRRWPMIGGAALGTLGQAFALAGGSRERGDGVALLDTVFGYFLQVPLAGLTGTGQAASAMVAYSGWIAAFIAILPFVLCAIWFAWGSWRRMAVVVIFGMSSAVIWSAGFIINYAPTYAWRSEGAQDLIDGVPLLRYAAIPTMFLFGIVALAIGRARRSALGARGIALGVAVVCLAVLAVGYRVPIAGLRAQGPDWTAGYQNAEIACEEGAASVAIPAAPSGWEVSSSCDVLP